MDLKNNNEIAAALLLADRIEAIMHALEAGLGILVPEAVAMDVAHELGYSEDNAGLADLAIHYEAVISRHPAGIILSPAELES